MKKLFIILSFVALSATVMAQKGVNFESATMTELLAKATKEGKPLFVDIYTTWCPPCKYMSTVVFPQDAAGEYFNKTFINAKFDAEKGEGITVAKQYKVKAYPTFLILNSKGEEIDRVIGGAEIDEFLETVKQKMKDANK